MSFPILFSGRAARTLDLLASPQRSLTRASGALAPTSAGGWQEVGSNVERTAYDAVATVDGGPFARNEITNPRAEGATLGTIGSGGTPPTGWAPQITGGVSVQIIGQVVRDGIPCLRVRASGTPSSNGSAILNFMANTALAAAAGDQWASAFYIARVAAPAPFTSYAMRLLPRTAAGAALTPGDVALAAPDGTLRRVFGSMTIDPGASTTAAFQTGFVATGTAGVPVDETWDIGAPQLYRGRLTDPGLVLLPPAGLPGPSGNLRPLGLLLEGQRSNVLPNPRAEGATVGTVGSGGALPTGWNLIGTVGFAIAVVGTGTEDGLPYVDLRFQGDRAANAVIAFSATTGTAAAAGQTWTQSLFARVVAGDVGGLTLGSSVRFRSSTGGHIENLNTNLAFGGAPLAQQRSSCTMQAASASTANVTGGLSITGNTGVNIDVTLRIGAGQLEQASFASSPILPAVGSPAVATRADDSLQIPLAAFTPEVLNATLLVEWLDLAGTVQPASRNVAAFGAGNSVNRLFHGYVDPSDNQVNGRVTRAGSNSFTGKVAALNLGGRNKWAATWSRGGRAAHCLNAGAVLSTGAAVQPDFATLTDGLRLLSAASGAGQFPGILARAELSIGRVRSDAGLQAITGA